MSAKKLVLVEKGVVIDKFAISEGSEVNITIGRNNNCDITISNSIVSSSHLIISQNSRNEIFVTDDNSTNGTFVNAKQISSNTNIKLNTNDVITIGSGGDIQIFVESREKIISNQSFLPKKTKYTIGRNPSCDIVLNSSVVSSNHCEILVSESKYIITDNNSTNGTYIKGEIIVEPTEISENEVIVVGDQEIRLCDYLEQKSENKQIDILETLKQRKELIIGRGAEADIVIDDNTVSRKHARIFFDNEDIYIEDLKSTNGTFINNKQISSKTKISTIDEIRIGIEVLSISKGKEKSKTTVIRAISIEKKYPNGYIGLQSLNINISSGSFVALMGPSGCGKTTLLNVLNGSNPSTKGKVFIHGLDLKTNYGLIKQKIGYVPQDDIVHKNLSVWDSLFYAAKLRMNEDTTDTEINNRINEVLSILNINDEETKNNYVKDLSGGQRKRISIAVELLNKPSILFLDEPTSPLDPETIDDFLSTLKKLTEIEGTTIVMVTHKPEDLNYVDSVLFLGKKGYVTFFGNVNKLYTYFNIEKGNINKIYSLMNNSEEATRWYKKWTKNDNESSISNDKIESINVHKYSVLRQYYWLTRRYLHLKLNDKVNLLLLFAQPVIIALLLSLIFDKFEVGVLFLMSVSAIWFGVSNAAKEIVDEVAIYSRERMYNIKILPYLLSKISVLSVIALIQVSIFVAIVYLRYSTMTVSLSNGMHYISIMFLLAFSATLLGLLLSAMFNNAEKVMTVVPIALLPQIMLAGVITSLNSNLKDFLSYFTLGRWGTEALSRVQSLGDKYEIFNEKILYISDHNQGGSIIDSISNVEIINKSVIQYLPQFRTATDTLIRNNLGELIPYSYEAGKEAVCRNPMDILNFYNENTLGWFNSLSYNLIVILAISLITFLAIYYSLYKKDSIKIN